MKLYHALLVLVIWQIGMARGWLYAAEPKVLRKIADFESGAPQSGSIVFWRWKAEEKQQAARYSRVALAESGAGGNGRGMRVVIPQSLPQGSEFYALWSTGLDYLPPESDAVRLRVKVVSGRFRLSLGSPTAYFATSDVRAKPQLLEPGDWRTVEFSLIRALERNYRRPIFSQESPVIYYTRWVQEPMRLLISADSKGELWVDDVELMASGNGRPFASYPENSVKTLSRADGRLPFTFATDDREFAHSHTPGKEAVRKPALLTPASVEQGVWSARQRGLEEMSFFGVPLNCPALTKALRLTLVVNHEGEERLDELSVDVLALVAPDARFPWEEVKHRIGPQEEGVAKGYDYCLSPTASKGLSWGFYHARRSVRQGLRTELVIPLTDFVCAYGTGDLKDRQKLQQPLMPGEVMAVALVSSYRQNRGDTVFSIERVEAVDIAPSFKQGGGSGVSYPIVPDAARIRLEFTAGEYGRQAAQSDSPTR